MPVLVTLPPRRALPLAAKVPTLPTVPPMEIADAPAFALVSARLCVPPSTLPLTAMLPVPAPRVASLANSRLPVQVWSAVVVTLPCSVTVLPELIASVWPAPTVTASRSIASTSRTLIEPPVSEAEPKLLAGLVAVRPPRATSVTEGAVTAPR